MYHQVPRPNEATKHPSANSITIEDILQWVAQAAARKTPSLGHASADPSILDGNEFINEDALAKRWWVSRKTLQRWRQAGDGLPEVADSIDA